jgi:peptidoglycan/LPS O-acetylase OafA/YrhL
MRKLTASWGHFMRFLGLATLIVGVVTAAMQKPIGWFVPTAWFLIAIFCMVTVVCTEVALTRDLLESKKEKQDNHIVPTK